MDIDNLVQDVRFGCQILLHRGKGKGAEPEKKHFWTGLRFEIYNKYRWYFRYRAALLQVQFPTRFVELRDFQYDYIPTELELKKRLRDKIIANKGTLTKWRNKIALYEDDFKKRNEKSLFPALLSDDEDYLKALRKVLALETKIITLEAEFKEKYFE